MNIFDKSRLFHKKSNHLIKKKGILIMKRIVCLLISFGLLLAQDALSQRKGKHDKQNIAIEYLDKNFGTYDALQKK
ncbi:MAG TPA: hypothetical protein DDZ04_05905, partial [Parabacteroides sp.]|nr:hypothetical protein [Parabacteroides sp.]